MITDIGEVSTNENDEVQETFKFDIARHPELAACPIGTVIDEFVVGRSARKPKVVLPRSRSPAKRDASSSTQRW